MSGSGYTPYHPAKYPVHMLPLFASVLKATGATSVLDPMAGTGRVWRLREHGFDGRIVVNDIESHWFDVPDWLETHVSDAARMVWAEDGEFDAICTSPTYGNRQADHHNAKDGSRRYTYRHTHWRDLHPENTGAMQWGSAYRDKHRAIWAECLRVLKPGGCLVLNVKDHYRDGEVRPVSKWHVLTLIDLGAGLAEHHTVPVRGNRNGANAELRVGHEDVWVLGKLPASHRMCPCCGIVIGEGHVPYQSVPGDKCTRCGWLVCLDCVDYVHNQGVVCWDCALGHDHDPKNMLDEKE